MVEVPHEVSPDQGHIQWVNRTRMDRAEKTFFKNKIFDGNGRRAKMRKTEPESKTECGVEIGNKDRDQKKKGNMKTIRRYEKKKKSGNKVVYENIHMNEKQKKNNVMKFLITREIKRIEKNWSLCIPAHVWGREETR